MLNSTTVLFQAVFTAVVLTLLVGQAGIMLSRRMLLMDLPGVEPHKQHKKPIPLAGGLTLALALPVLAMIFKLWSDPNLLGLLLAAVIVFIFGIWDDARRLPAWGKLLGQLAAAGVLVVSGVQVRIFQYRGFWLLGGGQGFAWLDILITLVWLVGVTNAYNLVDSMDGLSTGLSGWAFGFFMLAAVDSRQPGLSIFSAVLLGVCLGLYYYNAPPARLFLGDSGAQTLGFLLAGAAILYTPRDSVQNSSWFVPVLLLGVPLFDTGLVFFSRLRRGLPFYRGGCDHTYHRLVRWGLEPSRAVLVMQTSALLLQCAAFSAAGLPPLAANIVFAGCLLAALGVGIWMEIKINPDPT